MSTCRNRPQLGPRLPTNGNRKRSQGFSPVLTVAVCRQSTASPSAPAANIVLVLKSTSVCVFNGADHRDHARSANKHHSIARHVAPGFVLERQWVRRKSSAAGSVVQAPGPPAVPVRVCCGSPVDGGCERRLGHRGARQIVAVGGDGVVKLVGFTAGRHVRCCSRFVPSSVPDKRAVAVESSPDRNSP